MTYNVEMKRDEDGWAGRNISKVVETITTANPDIVGLQEDSTDWYKEKKYTWGSGTTQKNHLEGLEDAGYASTNFDDNKYERLNIFYKSDKLRLVDGAYGRESFKELAKNKYSSVVAPNGADMNRDNQDRMFSYAVFEILDGEGNGTGELILVVNTHLHWRKDSNDDGSSDENALVRQYESRILRAWLDDMVGKYPTQIVIGDMNDTPGDPPLSEFSKNDGFEFAKDTALVKGDVGGTLCSTTDYVTRDKYVFDHIAYRNVLAVEYTVINNKVDEVNGEMRYPSDHLPVMAKFVCTAG